MSKLVAAVSELVLEGVQDADSILKGIPTTHRQFERVYLRDELYDGEHPDRIDGLVVKPGTMDRIYRLYFPARRLIGWADFRGKNGKLVIRRKGEWKEPRSSIPAGREAEMQSFLSKLMKEGYQHAREDVLTSIDGEGEAPIGEVVPKKKGTVLVVVHPHSLFGSADFNIGPEQASIARKQVLNRIRRHRGPKVLVYDGEMKDDVDLSKLEKQMDKVYQGDAFEPDLDQAASEVMKDWPGQSFLVTGAWGDPSDGCAYHVAQALGGKLAPEVPRIDESVKDIEKAMMGSEPVASEESLSKVHVRLNTVEKVKKAADRLEKQQRRTNTVWSLLTDLDSAQLSAEDPEVKKAAKAAWEKYSNKFETMLGGEEKKLLKKLKSGMLPAKAPEGYAYRVVWADGRGYFLVRNKSDAIKFIEKGGNDVVQASLSPVKKGERVRNKLSVS